MAIDMMELQANTQTAVTKTRSAAAALNRFVKGSIDGVTLTTAQKENLKDTYIADLQEAQAAIAAALAEIEA